MYRPNKTKSAVFLYCEFSLFLKDPFFPDYFVEFQNSYYHDLEMQLQLYRSQITIKIFRYSYCQQCTATAVLLASHYHYLLYTSEVLLL